mgnify:CR=1 FL=1
MTGVQTCALPIWKVNSSISKLDNVNSGNNDKDKDKDENLDEEVLKERVTCKKFIPPKSANNYDNKKSNNTLKQKEKTEKSCRLHRCISSVLIFLTILFFTLVFFFLFFLILDMRSFNSSNSGLMFLLKVSFFYNIINIFFSYPLSIVFISSLKIGSNIKL